MTPLEQYAAPEILRHRFRELDLLGQLARGEIEAEVDDEYDAPLSAGQPHGTKSQRVIYSRGGEQIAIVHQYLLPDGRIGASGLPDPKWLRDGDTILKYRA